MTTQKPRRFCPVCGSKKIRWTLPQTWSNLECPECGYMGGLVFEEEIGEEPGKNIKKKPGPRE